MLRTLLAIALIACLPSAAFAQRSNQITAPSKLTTGKFVRNASAGNEFEVRSSQLALSRATSPRVRAFARRMVHDHSKAERQLRATVRKAGLKEPAGLDAKHMRLLGELRNFRGRDFERAYIDMQADGHMQTVAMFRNYVRNGHNQQVRQLAEKTLPILQEHLRMVQQLEARVAERR